MRKISKHLTYAEAVKSSTAEKNNIDNTPNADQLKAMELTAQAIFEPCRRFVGGALFVTSFFRSVELNTHKDVGGSKTSDHCKGTAIDIDADIYKGKTNAEIFHFIKNNLSFDQLIWEYGDSSSPNWVHASYRSEDANRKQVLIAYRDNGKVKYKRYE